MDEGGSFGRLVKRRRRILDLTQDDLARQTGYSVSAIRKVERDELRPSQPLAKALAEHLNVAPEEQARFVRLARYGSESGAGRSPNWNGDLTSPPATGRRSNLPAQPTALIGRDADIARGYTLLRRDDVRLLVLTGPPGVGKTHLALQLAHDLTADFADGVVFVALAPIDDPGLVAPAIARALGVSDTGARPVLDSVGDHLRDTRLLLVLDNFEHVLPAAPAVADLLAAAPRLKVLVTSREVLRLRGEQDYPVPPLSLPPRTVQDSDAEWEAIATSDAVRLFVARARAAKPSFELAPENAAPIAAICYHLDGLPLAIELAAARIRALPPRALLAQLGNRLSLLTGGARDLPPRQRTLRGAIAWSYELLDDSERALFRRLAVFAGGCTLEAAEAVAGSGAQGTEDGELGSLSRSAVLDGLTALVDKSLLRQDDQESGEPRFTMFESIREYAREQLDAAGEGWDAQKRHLAWYARWAERARPELGRANQLAWLNRFEADHDNARAALTWALANDPTAGLRLAHPFSAYWRRRGHLTETRRWLDVLLARTVGDSSAHASPADRRVRAGALGRAGNVALAQGDHQAATEYLKDSLAIYREVGDTAGIAGALAEMGRNHLLTGGDPEETRHLLEESLSASRASGQPQDVGWPLAYLGELAMTQRDDRQARSHIEASLAAFRQEGDLWGMNWCWINLGFLDLLAGDAPPARAHLEESLDVATRLGVPHYVGAVSLGLAGLDRLDGEVDRAQAQLRESVRLFREVGMPAIYDALCFLGEIATHQYDYQRSVRLFAAGAGPRALHVPIVCAVYAAACHPAWEACLAAARSALGEDAVAAAWAEGQAMTLEQAVAYALEGPRS